MGGTKKKGGKKNGIPEQHAQVLTAGYDPRSLFSSLLLLVHLHSFSRLLLLASEKRARLAMATAQGGGGRAASAAAAAGVPAPPAAAGPAAAAAVAAAAVAAASSASSSSSTRGLREAARAAIAAAAKNAAADAAAAWRTTPSAASTPAAPPLYRQQRQQEQQQQQLQQQRPPKDPGAYLMEQHARHREEVAATTVHHAGDGGDGGGDEEEGSVFAEYRCRSLPVDTWGLLPHPASVTEASSLAAVSPPPPRYNLFRSIPVSLAHRGVLSELQVESVLYCCQRHCAFLPNGYRAGFFIADGTQRNATELRTCVRAFACVDACVRASALYVSMLAACVHACMRALYACVCCMRAYARTRACAPVAWLCSSQVCSMLGCCCSRCCCCCCCCLLLFVVCCYCLFVVVVCWYICFSSRKTFASRVDCTVHTVSQITRVCLRACARVGYMRCYVRVRLPGFFVRHLCA